MPSRASGKIRLRVSSTMRDNWELARITKTSPTVIVQGYSGGCMILASIGNGGLIAEGGRRLMTRMVE